MKRAARYSSSVKGVRITASGFRLACLRNAHATAPSCSVVVPYSSMCQRMKGAGRSHAVGKPQSGAAAAVGVRRATVVIARGAAVVAVDQGDDFRHAGGDHRDGGLDADAGEAALPGGDSRIARVDAGDLAKTLVIRNAVDDEAVDIAEAETAVLERHRERPYAEIVGVVFRKLAVARRADARHRDAPGELRVHPANLGSGRPRTPGSSANSPPACGCGGVRPMLALVTYRVERSAPPNMQLVGRCTGMRMLRSSFPSGA